MRATPLLFPMYMSITGSCSNVVDLITALVEEEEEVKPKEEVITLDEATVVEAATTIQAAFRGMKVGSYT